MAAEYNVAEEVLRKALSEREAKRNDLDKEIEGLKETLSFIAQSRLDEEPQLPEASPAPDGVTRDFWAVRHAKGSLSQEVTDAILEILGAERPMPMHRKKIMEMVEAKGIVLGGKVRIRTLSSYLSNDRRFVNVKKNSGVWALADSPLPEGLQISRKGVIQL